MAKKKLNCQSPQCGYWREATGCSIDENADNDALICEKGEERCEYQIFVVVEGGLVNSVFSDKPDIAVEVLDLDAAGQDSENEDVKDEMRERIENIETKYHQLY
jgi:transcription elongation factor Elf1